MASAPAITRDRSRFWRAEEVGNLEILSASFIRHAFPRHTHDSYVIALIVAGHETIYCNGDIHHAFAGDIVIVNPGEVHTGEPGEDGGWTYLAMYPTAECFAEASGLMLAGRSAPEFLATVIRDRPLASRMHVLYETLLEGNDPLAAQCHLRIALTELVRRHADDAKPLAEHAPVRRAVAKARDLIHSEFDRPIHLKELANAAGLSPFHLLRVFQEELGLPPHAYLTQVRIQNAKRMIRAGTPIGEVAISTGFTDQSHMTKWFKRLVGVTPGRYC